MSYKGSDLNLRMRPGAISELPDAEERIARRAAAGPTAEPIDVDDLVLSCCNAAYDVARFHGVHEVRLEHLLHGLTRLAAATEIVQQLGIRTGVLRRETAIAIAAETPAAESREAIAPRASAAFEDVLLRAADSAALRRSSASVHDLLRTLLAGGPESPAAALLMRAASDVRALERWRDEPRREALAPVAQTAAAPVPAVDWPPALLETLIRRLDEIERSVRGLRAEAAADRRAIGDLVRTVQSELSAWRSEQALAAPATHQGHAFDPAIETRLGELGSAIAALTERVATVDRQAESQHWATRLDDLGRSLAALTTRFAAVDDAAGDHWGELNVRLKAIEDRTAAPDLDGVANSLTDVLSQHLAPAQAGLERLEEELARHRSAADERQIALEASVRAHLGGTEEAGKTHARDLGEIYEALVKLGANQQTLGNNFNTWRLESSGDIAIIGNRLQQLEQSAAELLGRLDTEVQSLRQEAHQSGARRGNGFKRWLYGTDSVFASSWRDEAASIRTSMAQPPFAPRHDEKS